MGPKMQQFRGGENSSIMLKKWGETEGEVGENRRGRKYLYDEASEIFRSLTFQVGT